MSIPFLVAKLARVSQRAQRLGSRSQSQQYTRRLSLFGDFFKRIKSEANSNEELQRAVSELKKTGESVRERAKAASKVVENAATASSEAAKAAAQQAQKQASEVSAAFREQVSKPGREAKSTLKDVSSTSTPEAAKTSTATSTSTGSPTDTQRSATTGSSAAQAERQTGSTPGTPGSDQAAAGSSGFTDAPPTGSAGTGPSATSTEGSAGTGTSAGVGASAGTGAGPGERAKTGADAGPKADSRHRAAAAGLLARVRSAVDTVRREVIAAVMPDDGGVSATRAVNVQPRDAKDATTSTSLMATPIPRFQQQWQELQDKLGLHPIFKRLQSLRDNKVFNKGREMAEDIRERWETSDSAMVQRVQDMKDSMFSETEMAATLREIRARDPRFDMVVFLQRLKKDVPVVIKGSLEGDAPLLKQHCAPEMVERFSGVFAVQQAQGRFFDSTILDHSDVELVDLKFLESHPIVLVQFTVQQLNCIRDKHGNVVEGDPNSVQRVYYYWALQQDTAGFVGVDGKAYPPRWQLREQVVRAMHNLL